RLRFRRQPPDESADPDGAQTVEAQRASATARYPPPSQPRISLLNAPEASSHTRWAASSGMLRLLGSFFARNSLLIGGTIGSLLPATMRAGVLMPDRRGSSLGRSV